MLLQTDLMDASDVTGEVAAVTLQGEHLEAGKPADGETWGGFKENYETYMSQ